MSEPVRDAGRHGAGYAVGRRRKRSGTRRRQDAAGPEAERQGGRATEGSVLRMGG